MQETDTECTIHILQKDTSRRASPGCQNSEICKGVVNGQSHDIGYFNGELAVNKIDK